MDNRYENLLVVLKLFQNRPHHLSKFLIENKAITPEFLKKISDSDKLSEMAKKGIKENHVHFNTIYEMAKYYTSLIDDLENLKLKKSKQELTIELNQKLKSAIESENYEEASRIRDYMKNNDIEKFNLL